MRGGGKVGVRQDALGLRQCSKILPLELLGCSLSIQSKTAWNTELGSKLLRIWVRAAELGVGGVALPGLLNHRGLQKCVQCLTIKFNQLPLNSNLPRRLVL